MQQKSIISPNINSHRDKEKVKNPWELLFMNP